VDGKPAPDRRGVAHQRFEFDDRRREVKVENLGADNRPFVSGEGIAAWTKHYDPEGREIERRFLGSDGKPCRNLVWSWGQRYTYDVDGKQSSLVDIDQNGNELVLQVVVFQIYPGKAAERAGLKIGDIVERYADRPISVPNDVTEAVKSLPMDDALHDVVIRRDGKPIVVQMPAGSPGCNFGKRFVPK
jgi:hypothetical protein